jgi:hypothetical protein
LRYGESLKHQESSRTDTTSHSSPFLGLLRWREAEQVRFNFPHTLIHKSIRKTKYEVSSSERIRVRAGDENNYRCPMSRVAVASKHNALDERMRFNRPYAVIADRHVQVARAIDKGTVQHVQYDDSTHRH